MIGVIATLKIAAGKDAEFEEAAKALVAKVNANEPGCLMYELYRSPTSPDTYVFMEKYKDKAALEAHSQTDYFLAAQPVLGACLAAKPDIQSYVPVS
jgi:quinol monooxygenase YgiN